ncbi:hypothetical protein DSO57_1036143 [Entomophthora muscae]|uniref:Uncharacterized protein n=1 Tax=Entomophthora muscae TaxID=34485 RepID=A0ACC2TA53_9FUNG|nr:hypothetical protein DSO57_1036143 [Entomophthora muscae]
MELWEKRALNLKVLKRHDMTIDSILDQSSHVVIYNFDVESQQWKNAGYEGSMFIFKRTVAPFYGVLVLNRRSIDNFIFLLTPDLEIHVDAEFIIYRRPKDSIIGIWLYEKLDRIRIAHQLENYSKQVASKMSSPVQSDIDGFEDRTDRQVENSESQRTNQPRLKARRQPPSYYSPSMHPPETQALPKGTNLTDLLKATFPDDPAPSRQSNP